MSDDIVYQAIVPHTETRWQCLSKNHISIIIFPATALIAVNDLLGYRTAARRATKRLAFGNSSAGFYRMRRFANCFPPPNVLIIILRQFVAFSLFPQTSKLPSHTITLYDQIGFYKN